MKISFAWLCEFADPGLAPAELGQALTMAGLALDGIDGEGDATVLDLAATTNRPDWLSHYGVAREVAAVTGASLRPLPFPPRAHAAAPPPLKVFLDAADGCALYHAQWFEDVRVRPSGGAVAERLTLLGHRGINNIADFTNYTLQEMGHPTHAFDADRIRGGGIHVRYARAGEHLVTLDEVERTLGPGDLIIADAVGPIALAGIMGGLESAISDNTRRVVVESAWFYPAAVRATAKRHGLRTEASFRFERGADPAAALAAASLLTGRIAGNGARPLALVTAQHALPAKTPVRLRPAALRRWLGGDVPEAEVHAILTRLGLVPAATPEHWLPPSWRHDLTQEADLVEEVARVHGYDKFPARLPVFSGYSRPNQAWQRRDRVRELLRGRGYAEALSLSFAAEVECLQFAPGATPVRVLNPLSDEAAILRTSSLPAMLHLLANNVHRGQPNPKLFEAGKRYGVTPAGTPEETAVLTLGVCGAAQPPHWSETPRGYDFYDLKGAVDAVFDLFQHAAPVYVPEGAPEALHPGRSALIEAGGLKLGVVGQLAPATAEAWKLPTATWVAEIDLAPLIEAGARQPAFLPPSRFPAGERDFSFLFPDSLRWSEIAAALSAPPIPTLVEFQPAEIFRGPKLGEGVYSLLLRARFQLDDRTLRDDEIQAGADAIAERLRALGGRQR